MANESVAAINCTMQINGHVRMKQKGGAYKYYLYTEKYGPQFFNTSEGQAFLIKHMTEKQTQGDKVQEPEKQTQGDKVTEPPAETKETGFMDW